MVLYNKTEINFKMRKLVKVNEFDAGCMFRLE